MNRRGKPKYVGNSKVYNFFIRLKNIWKEFSPWKYAILFFLSIFILGMCSEKNVNNTPPVNWGKNKNDAYWIVKEFVSNRLKSPATADYPNISKTIYHQVDDVWVFNGYVDSQNSFGALIRTYFVCGVEYVPTTDKWKLIELEFIKR